MLPNPGPGRLFVIEGLDGAGTTTQLRLLWQRLGEQRPVWVTHEPTDGPAGLQIRMILEHRLRTDPATLAALFAADRVDHLYDQQGDGGIVPRLQRGVDVISDRYYLSSFAYQGMTLDWEWIWHLHAHCIRPNLTLFIDVPPATCLERIARGRGRRFELFETQEALTRVRQGYLQAIDRLRQLGERIEVLDGGRPPPEVHSAVWELLSALQL